MTKSFLPPKTVSGRSVLNSGVRGGKAARPVKGQPPRVTVALARPQMSGHEGRKINVLDSSTQSIFQGTTTLIYL